MRKQQEREKLPRYNPVDTGCPAIEKGIEELYRENGEKSFHRMVAAIRYAIRIQTDVLVPLAVEMSASSVAGSWAKNPLPADKGKDLRLWHLFHKDGRVWLCAFSNSAEAVRSRATAYTPMMQCGLFEMIRRAIETEGISGLVLNPWGHSATLEKGLLDYILREQEEATDEIVGEEIQALLAEGDSCAGGSPRLNVDNAKAVIAYREAWRRAEEMPNIRYQPEVYLRYAEYEVRHISPKAAALLAAEARQGFSVRAAIGDKTAQRGLKRTDELLELLRQPPKSETADETELFGSIESS